MSDIQIPTIAFATHKGGAAKTTSALNLAAELGRAGFQVLLVDLDPQANASLHAGKLHPSQVQVTLSRLLTERMDSGSLHLLTASVHQDTNFENVSIIYGSIDLNLIDEALRSKAPRPSEELRMTLEPLSQVFDVIVIDTPPALNLLTRNGLAAATHLIIPIESGSQYSLYGMNDLLGVIHNIQRINPQLQSLGALLVKHDERKKACKVLAEVAQSTFERLIPVRISDSTVIEQASIAQTSAYGQDRTSKVARDYKALADYVIDSVGLKRPRPAKRKPAKVAAEEGSA